jgi:hypothetical protein
MMFLHDVFSSLAPKGPKGGGNNFMGGNPTIYFKIGKKSSIPPYPWVRGRVPRPWEPYASKKEMPTRMALGIGF